MSVTHAAVQSLWIKRERGISMSRTQHLDLLKGYGIKGDVNADDISPRQVLIVNSQDLFELSIPSGSLRENIVLDQVSSEAFKSGAMIFFPSGAAIRLTFYCEPCKRIVHLVDSLKNIVHKRGVLGVVVQSGAIKTGDITKIKPNYFPALSDKPYERFLDLSLKIPRGKVVTYQQVIRSIGVDKSYFRAIPSYLKKTPSNYPIHRILDSKGRIVSHIPQQKSLLEAEGVEFISNVDVSNISQLSVSLEKYAWQNSSMY